MTPKERAEELVTEAMAEKALAAWLARPKGTHAIASMQLALLAAFTFAVETGRIQ